MGTALAPSSSLLSLGKGEIFFDRRTVANVRGGFFHLGNCEVFELTIEDDLLEKYSSMSSGSPLYKRVTRRRNTQLRVQMDEWSNENLALFLMGDVTEWTQPATAITAEVLTTNVTKGRYYKFAKIGPYTGITLTQMPATALVLGTDYRIVDAILGIVQILATSVTVTNGSTVQAAYTPTLYTAGTTGRGAVAGGTRGLIEGSVMFRPDPASGPRWGVDVWNVSVAPDGALGYISEEFGSFTMTMAVQDDTAGLYGGSATYPTFRMIDYPTS